jgi:hypothetical protein
MRTTVIDQQIQMTTKRTLFFTSLFALFVVIFFACQNQADDPVTGGTTGPGSTTGTTGPGGNTGTLSVTVTAAVSNSATTNTSCNSTTGPARVVCLAEAFKAMLDPTQLAAAQLPYSKTDAVKWSNFPQGATNPPRVGVKLGSLNTTQLAAFRDLMTAVLTLSVANEGYDELVGIMAADDYLSTANGQTNALFGSGNYYLTFLGTPSTTGRWELQYGGHHYAFADTYNNGQVAGVTPSFRGVEPSIPISSTGAGRTFQPMEEERLAFATLLTGLSTSEQPTAKLSATFSDLVLGPGKDGQFPAVKQGIRVGDLSADNQALVLNAIKLYVNDLDPVTGAPVLAKYTTDLANTYLAYTSTGTMNTQTDYVRIDGPNVWIEYSVQGSTGSPGTTHPHSVWRDRTSDYGGN